MIRILIILIYLVSIQQISAQEESWMYIIAKDSLFEPNFYKHGDGNLKYSGKELGLKSVLENYKVKTFKKTHKNTTNKTKNRTFFVQASSDDFLENILDNAPHLFSKGIIIPLKDRKIFEPNDYGTTSTIGDNIGLQVNMGYMDFLGIPKAWHYTTGSRDVILGISDGLVNQADIEVQDKIVSWNKSSVSGGHGTSVAVIAAGQGNNGQGVAGVCYDCSIASDSYGSFKYLDQVTSLSGLNAKAINCSWAGIKYYAEAENIIDSLYNKGIFVVASSGNRKWNKTRGKVLMYPASYEKVISVGTVMYEYEKPKDNIKYLENGNPYIESIKGYVGRTGWFRNNDVSTNDIRIYNSSVTTLNSAVDILAPSVGVFRYGKYLIDGKESYIKYSATSPSSPFVTGTIGLMYSLYPCLPHDEVESILKMTAMNIDHIEANQPYVGNYGAGILQTGDAVEMVFQLYNEKETAYIKEQQFNRWDFKLTSLSKEIVMENQKFTENATLNLTAKNKIILKPGTLLKPNRAGRVHLKIDSTLTKKCDLVLRDPNILEK